MTSSLRRQVADLLVRPALETDLGAMSEITNRAFHLVDQRLTPRALAIPPPRTPSRQQAWIARTRSTLQIDPGGVWVAEVDGEVVGCAVSRVRELMWILSTFAVSPERQGLGIGSQLLDAARHYGRGCLRGMLAASADPAAFRRYRLAGFAMHPQVVLRGRVDRAVLPVVEHVRAGVSADRDLMDSVDRATRGAAHGVDHDILMQQARLVVTDRSTGQGYAYAAADGAPILLAATNRRTAIDLMWECLASSDPEVPVAIAHITAANTWAIDIGMQARLDPHQEGYLGLRNMKPPVGYLHHGSML